MSELDASGPISEKQFRKQLETSNVISRTLKQSGIYFETTSEGQASTLPFPRSIGPFELKEAISLKPGDVVFNKFTGAEADAHRAKGMPT